MTNKKSNPVMSPEWLDSLLSVDVVPEPGTKAAFDEMHRKRQAEEIAIEEDWRTVPVLLSLSILLQSLGRANYEQARQETQTINRCLALGASPNPVLLSCMLRDLIG